MERVEFRNTRGSKLVGNLHASAGDAGIILAHGFTSDKSALGRFDSLSEALHQAGYNVLAFDFSGCGESDPEILAAHNMVDDLRCAVEFLRTMGPARMGLYGHSLGGTICLKCADAGVETMVLSGAATDKMDYDWNQYYSEAQLTDLKRKGSFTLVDRTGKERTIGRQMLMDFEEIDQRTLLGSVTCPVLLIHGNHRDDDEELALLERSHRGMQFLPEGSRLEIIEGANHTFLGHWASVITLATGWYLRHIPIA
ncbi:MAG TPA: alpha/beta hydrolase [Bacteroidota bacterium]|nr:alpha/beta hydrolase [Bacteroidota bacterium]